MGDDEYIWIVRWPDFQHYPPERDRPPAFIKAYTKQLFDDRYTDLGLTLRGLLNDTRTAFAVTAGHLSNNTQTLGRRIGAKVQRRQLDALVHAGFIEIVSRETLEQRLDEFYASRAPARAHARSPKLEVDLPLTPPEVGKGRSTRAAGTNPRAVVKHDLVQRQQQLHDEARKVAANWNGGDSVHFDETLDELEHSYGMKIGFLERDRLWEAAFKHRTPVEEDELF